MSHGVRNIPANDVRPQLIHAVERGGKTQPRYTDKASGGRKPYPLETMLRTHLLQIGSP